MVAEVADISIEDIYRADSVDLETLTRTRQRIRGLSALRQEAKEILAQWVSLRNLEASAETTAALEGHLHFCLGDIESSLRVLEEIRLTEIGAVLLSWCYREVGQPGLAENVLEMAYSRNPASAPLILDLAEVKIELRKLDEAWELLQSCEDNLGMTAHHTYLKAFYRELWGDYDQAMEEYRGLLETDPDNPKALFRLAYNEDMRGEQEAARDLYQRCCDQVPAYTSALMNLGLVHEDLGDYTDAIDCYERVLTGEPNNSRARMFLGDARASVSMYYDEEKQKRQDKRAQILKTPITDFELSVRSRNCLNKMNIRSLGDLIHKTEAELLSYKNFGETSLNEIKQMLTSKNLGLGMPREEGDEFYVEGLLDMEAPQEEDEVLGRSVETLELSGRGRKAIEALGILTVGDLIQKSEAELLTVKNFGHTSLTELKKKLEELGLELKA